MHSLAWVNQINMSTVRVCHRNNYSISIFNSIVYQYDQRDKGYLQCSAHIGHNIFYIPI